MDLLQTRRTRATTGRPASSRDSLPRFSAATLAGGFTLTGNTMKPLDLVMAGALLAALLACTSLEDTEDSALCHTDTECAELCPTGTRDLPSDHPDYCDGGPQS